MKKQHFFPQDVPIKIQTTRMQNIKCGIHKLFYPSARESPQENIIFSSMHVLSSAYREQVDHFQPNVSTWYV